MNLSHRFRQRLLLGVSVLCGAGLMFGVSSASAMPVEYVKVCSLYGANFAYSPGTDNCMDTAPLEYRKQTEFGTMSNYIQHGGGSLVYGTNGYATGTDSSAFGDGAFAGGNPNGDIIVPPPVTRDPSSPDYDSSYIDFYDTETNHGVVNRALFPASRYPYSSFFNAGATAIGQGAQAGASGAGEANATAVGQGALANAKNATTVGQGSSADAQGATALGQGSSAGAQKATAVGQGAVASAASSVAIGQGSAATQANTVSFGAPGAERRLVNVAAGVMGTDAVNVDQLNAAVLSVAAQQGDAVGGNSQGLAGPSASGDGAYAGGQGASASGQDSLAVGNGANASGPGAVALGAGAQATGDPTTAVGNMAVASGNNSSAFGGGATASGVNSLALGQGSTASALGGTAIGQGASVTAANSVALGAGSIASRGAQSGYTAYGLSGAQNSAGEVSVGSAGGERQITNVAAGSAANDAVNLGQLQGAVADGMTNAVATAVTSANAYTDSQVGLLRRRADSGTAAAMAMAGLISPSTPGKTVLTGGVGLWRDQTALAFGLSHRFDNAWTVKAGGSFATSGGSGASAAFGYEF